MTLYKYKEGAFSDRIEVKHGGDEHDVTRALMKVAREVEGGFNEPHRFFVRNHKVLAPGTVAALRQIFESLDEDDILGEAMCEDTVVAWELEQDDLGIFIDVMDTMLEFCLNVMSMD